MSHVNEELLTKIYFGLIRSRIVSTMTLPFGRCWCFDFVIFVIWCGQSGGPRLGCFGLRYLGRLQLAHLFVTVILFVVFWVNSLDMLLHVSFLGEALIAAGQWARVRFLVDVYAQVSIEFANIREHFAASMPTFFIQVSRDIL